MPHTYDDLAAAGTTFAIQITGAFTTVPGVTSIDWDGLNRAQRNPTSLSDGRTRKKRGLPNYGEIKVEGNYDPNNAVHQLLQSKTVGDEITDDLDVFKITRPDEFGTHAFVSATGYVSEFATKTGEAESGTQTFSCTIPVDYATWTAGV